jgi:hypothetical protein
MADDDIVPIPSEPKRGCRWRLVFILLAIFAGLLLIVLVGRYVLLRNQIAESAFDHASTQAISAAEQLETDFAQTEALALQLAQDLSDGTLAYENIAPRLRELLEDDPQLDGITVAFDHGAYSPDYDLFFTYVYRDPVAGYQVDELESQYDYTLPPSDDPDAPQTAWYYVPATAGPAWTEPFLAAGAGRVLIEFGAPFSSPDSGGDEPAGVVAVDYTLEGMRELVAGLDLGRTGYGAVYADSGTFLSHPIPEHIVERNIFTDPALQEEDFQDAARRALEGDTVSIQREVAEGTVWNFFTPIMSTGWGLVVQLSESEFLLGEDALLNNLVAIVLAGGAFLFFLLAVLLHFDRSTRDRLWLASITFSVIGAIMIVIIIVLARNTPQDLAEGVLLASQASLSRVQEALNIEYHERGLNPPVEVPTGVLIQSAKFPDPTIVNLNGYLWQRVPKEEGVELTPGVTFPQSIDEPFMFEEIYREERESETLYVWWFTAALRQAFDPDQYPLDIYDIDVRMAPMEFTENALLVPDLENYNVTAPRLLPGIDDTVRINNWQLLASAFGMGFRDYGTNFSIAQRPTIDVPELSFNIRIERRFLGPFIAFFLPAFVATIMIFGFLLIEHKPDESEEIVTALTYTAALFFVVAVLHTALRENAAAIGLTYLEYFYILLYVLTLLVALNSFLVVKYPWLPVISIGDNLISKVLFWPTVVGFMLIVTVYVFVIAR